MPLLSVATLVINALTLILALEFLLVIYWNTPHHPQAQLLGVLLITLAIWSTGAALALAAESIGLTDSLFNQALGMMRIGFISTIIAIYAFTTATANLLTRRFLILLILGWLCLLVYQLLMLPRVNIAGLSIALSNTTNQINNVIPPFYLIFVGATLYVFWRYRLRIPFAAQRFGILMFSAGLVIAIIRPGLPTTAVAVALCSVAGLLISLSVLRQQIIIPLRERTSQVEAMHDMSLAITSQLSPEVILRQIANQTLNRLNADGVAVFLTTPHGIEVGAVDNLPSTWAGTVLPTEQGIVGAVVRHGETIYLENYERDWPGADDLPYASLTFGAVICVPLMYAETVIGALLAVTGKRQHAFQPDDAHLLQMLGAQAAVAIKHGQLFTQQQTLNEEIASARNQLETLLTSTENPVVAVNRQLERVFTNKAAERLFPALQYATGPVTDVLPPQALPANLLTVVRNIRQRRVHTYEIVFNDRVYMSHIAPLEEVHAIDGWVAVLNDVTDLKELDRLKSEMVRMTSHDLKNPLQAALAHLDLLSDSLTPTHQADDDIAYSLNTLEHQLLRMYRIISGVLDVERVRAGAQTIQTCQPANVIQHVLEDMHALAQDQAITLTSDIASGLPTFHGDPGQLERALANLVENAIKFTPEGGQVQLAAYTDADQIVFRITDNGIGIPTTAHANVFDSFFRANQKGAEHITGTGLGLHLVKTIVENHSGRVWLESEESIGTTFFISIPIRTGGIV
jgi:two-component system, OmpR family, phosphate regulon sensor histidine kinase PhoR